MYIFDRLFRKSNDINKLEGIYLKTSNGKNQYGIQDKYFNQSKKLLSIFGKIEERKINKIKLLIITDTHNMLDYLELNQMVNEHPNYDLCVLLGDHSIGDIEKILKCIPREKIYALLGNHDSVNYIDKYNLNDLNGKYMEYNGVKFMGIKGSFKYKPDEFPSFTQEESILFLKDMPKVDILFSHDGPFNDELSNFPPHQGLFGITYYLFKNKVKYNIHGHLHSSFRKKLINGTEEICVYGINYIELGGNIMNNDDQKQDLNTTVKYIKNNEDDKIWWVRNPEQKGERLFTFDKENIFNLFEDYPYKLTKEQKEIFDKENPYWADFFKDR